MFPIIFFMFYPILNLFLCYLCMLAAVLAAMLSEISGSDTVGHKTSWESPPTKQAISVDSSLGLDVMLLHDWSI